MNVIVLILYIKVIFVTSQNSSDVIHKIVGGKEVDIIDYPYQLSLQNSGVHSCGATLISPRWAITAAHCVERQKTRSLTVRGGSSEVGNGGQVVKIRTIYRPKQYSSALIDYDVALLKLSSTVSYKSAKIITLASAEYNISKGSVGTVSGWGITAEGGLQSKILKAVNVTVVSRSTCRTVYGSKTITNNMFCAGDTSGGKDSCQGDSGGPFVINGTLVGIVSWGYGCARPDFPGVYTSIPSVRDFIDTVFKIYS